MEVMKKEDMERLLKDVPPSDPALVETCYLEYIKRGYVIYDGKKNKAVCMHALRRRVGHLSGRICGLARNDRLVPGMWSASRAPLCWKRKAALHRVFQSAVLR